LSSARRGICRELLLLCERSEQESGVRCSTAAFSASEASGEQQGERAAG